LTIAGTGSNYTKEAIVATRHAENIGINTVLLVDPYYNGPSSQEIRKEYVEPIAQEFSEIQIIPYVIPSRTGTQLLPHDLAILHHEHSNVRAVKEATGNLENMKLTRKLCGNDFDILSGDDNLTYQMMVSAEIGAAGVISVVSNIAPKATQNMIQNILNNNRSKALELSKALDPLFEIVTINVKESTQYGFVDSRNRNPLPFKTLMNILGMPSGPCRQPLGRLTKKGIKVLLNNARKVYENNPNILEPLEDFFDIDLSRRLYSKNYWRNLHYA
jgi:4-hydroxy-tetrahydrodipicolinate synthase